MAYADISVRINVKAIEKTLSAFARQQIPYATALALTALAKKVQAEETKALSQVFDRPTPFTLKAIGTKAARKSNLVASVYVKDIAASYLAPYEFGGMHKQNGRATLNPKAVQTNQYGNLPKNLIARLKGRSDVFIGAIKTKNGGVVNGVWQRPLATAPLAGRKGLRGSNRTDHLKLLIRFTDAQPVKQHLSYRARAQRVVNANFNAEFNAAMAIAMATAKR